jgi:hypothetical protein
MEVKKDRAFGVAGDRARLHTFREFDNVSLTDTLGVPDECPPFAKALTLVQGCTNASLATPELLALRERVRELPRIAAYLASGRRMPFNQDGIFRRYPELDAPTRAA